MLGRRVTKYRTALWYQLEGRLKRPEYHCQTLAGLSFTSKLVAVNSASYMFLPADTPSTSFVCMLSIGISMPLPSQLPGSNSSNGFTTAQDNEPAPILKQIEVRVGTASKAKRPKLAEVNKCRGQMVAPAVVTKKKKRRSKMKSHFTSQVCFLTSNVTLC